MKRPQKNANTMTMMTGMGSIGPPRVNNNEPFAHEQQARGEEQRGKRVADVLARPRSLDDPEDEDEHARFAQRITRVLDEASDLSTA